VALTVGLDSYGSLDELESILVDLGHGSYIDSRDQLAMESDARNAVLYLDLGWQWRGRRTDPDQALAFPRTGIRDQDGVLIAPDVVPSEIVVAQSLLMVAAGAGPLDGGTGGNSPDREIRREAADDAVIEYEPGSAARRYPQVSALVAHLCTSHLMGGFRQVAGARG
jgi:hypothetical protein